MSDTMRTEGLMSLSCSYCGAPLNPPAAGSEYVNCASCGTTQKMVDARAFLDQIMGQVYGWVRAAIPSGFDFSHAENADPIARHNIFVNYVKPKLSTEFMEYRFNLFNLLSNPLMNLPFGGPASLRPIDTSQRVFEFNAKNKSIIPLAVDDESKSLVSEVDRFSTTYAYLINNTKLMKDQKPERYSLMAANLGKSHDLLKGDASVKPLADRIDGLRLMAAGTDQMLGGNLAEANASLASSKESLDRAKNGVIGNMNLGVMYQAIEKELLIINVLNNMIKVAEMDPMGNPLNSISSMDKVMKLASSMDTNRPPRWASAFRDQARLDEILNWIYLIRQSRNGGAGLEVLNGGGTILFPFWMVDFPYSFKTGSLWMKKGVEASEVIMVSASFATDDSTLYNPASALTDVFGYFEGSGILSSFSGKETTLTNGGSLRDISRYITRQGASGRYVIPPLSTQKEVSMFMEDYIAGITRANSNVAKKLKLSAPRIRGLVFVPGEISQNSYSINYDFGGIRPKSIGNLGRISQAVV